MRDYKKILVVQTAFPGDIVLTTPLFKALKKRFPESKLAVLTTPPGYELLRDIKEIDSIIPYDKRGSGITGFIKLMRRLRSESFDLCISPHRSSRTALMVFATGAPVRIGFSDASLPFLYNRKVYRDKTLHEVERVLSLLTFSPSPQSPPAPSLPSPLTGEGEGGGEFPPPLHPLPPGEGKLYNEGWGEGGFDKAPYLEISAEVWNRARKLFEDAGIASNDTVIGIAPGSVWATKRWTAEGYALLIDGLGDRYDAKVLLIGSPSERKTGDEILSLTRHKPVDLIGKTTLRQLIAVIDRCRLLIGNDSAPGHIAAARMVPVVSIFGPTSPAFGYYPYGKDVVIVEKELSCRPCHHHGPEKCPEGHFRCMRDITVDDVMEAVKKLLTAPPLPLLAKEGIKERFHRQ